MWEIIQPDLKKKTFKNSITNSENNLLSGVKQTEWLLFSSHRIVGACEVLTSSL